MACRGVHFALTGDQVAQLVAAREDAEVMRVVEQIEEEWDPDWLAEMDKAWDALHRCLTDGTLRFDGGEYPLSHAVLGGRPLHDGDDYIVSLVDADQVRDVAEALSELDETWLRGRFLALDPDDGVGPMDEGGFRYVRWYFRELRALYSNAAKAGRSVIFTVDQ